MGQSTPETGGAETLPEADFLIRTAAADHCSASGTRIPIDNTKRLRSPTTGVDLCRMTVGYLSPIDYEGRDADKSRTQPAWGRARGRQGRALRTAQKWGPSLYRAARDGRTIVRAGTEEWLRQGPNKGMPPNRRAKCRQTRYPDPKLSGLHETGASPLAQELRARMRRSGPGAASISGAVRLLS